MSQCRLQPPREFRSAETKGPRDNAHTPDIDAGEAPAPLCCASRCTSRRRDIAAVAVAAGRSCNTPGVLAAQRDSGIRRLAAWRPATAAVPSCRNAGRPTAPTGCWLPSARRSASASKESRRTGRRYFARRAEFAAAAGESATAPAPRMAGASRRPAACSPRRFRARRSRDHHPVSESPRGWAVFPFRHLRTTEPPLCAAPPHQGIATASTCSSCDYGTISPMQQFRQYERHVAH